MGDRAIVCRISLAGIRAIGAGAGIFVTECARWTSGVAGAGIGTLFAGGIKSFGAAQTSGGTICSAKRAF